MHTIEPHYNWIEQYSAAEDPRSPLFGAENSLEAYTNTIYGYYIHPQWDSLGSETLFFKILYADYDDGTAVLELLGKAGWPDASATLRLLCIAALFRGLAETFPSLYVAAGRPDLSLAHSIANLALVAACMLLGLACFPQTNSVLIVAAAWLVATALLMGVSLILVQRVVPLRPMEWLLSMARPMYAALGASAALVVAQVCTARGDAAWALAVDVCVILLATVLGARFIRGTRLSSLGVATPL